jgi:hypothetical protein
MSISYNSSIVTNGLALCLDAGNPRSYPGSGTAWNDASGVGNNGTMINGPTYNSSNLGSIVFDGVDDYVDCGNATSLQLATAVTLESWCNPTSSTGLGTLIQKNTNSGYRFRIESGNLWAYSSGVAAVASGGICTNNNWWHCVATFGSGGIICYVNGTQVASTGTAYTPGNVTAGNLQIGCYSPGSETFNGKISIARVYNRVLSTTEITQNFNALRGRYGV